MALDNFKQKIVEKSDMYNFYKRDYEKRGEKLDVLMEKLQLHNEFIEDIFTVYNIKSTPFLTSMRKLSFEFIRLIDGICRKHEVTYWLDNSTLLGAVRYGNFMPWSDNLEIGLMRNDYDRFKESITKEVDLKNIKIQDNQIKYEFPDYEYPLITLNVNAYEDADVLPLKEMPFGPYEFSSPNDSIAYLKNIYDDLVSIPDDFKDSEVLKYYMGLENIDEILEDNYTILKNLNDEL